MSVNEPRIDDDRMREKRRFVEALPLPQATVRLVVGDPAPGDPDWMFRDLVDAVMVVEGKEVARLPLAGFSMEAHWSTEASYQFRVYGYAVEVVPEKERDRPPATLQRVPETVALRDGPHAARVVQVTPEGAPFVEVSLPHARYLVYRPPGEEPYGVLDRATENLAEGAVR